MSLTHIASKVLNAPLLLEPGYGRVFFSALVPRLQMDITQLTDIHGTELTLEDMQAEAQAYGEKEQRTYQVHNGVAVLPIIGSLVHKLNSVQPWSGMTGYNGIITRVNQALRDPDVKGILSVSYTHLTLPTTPYV